jgi:hypothetical protein
MNGITEELKCFSFLNLFVRGNLELNKNSMQLSSFSWKNVLFNFTLYSSQYTGGLKAKENYVILFTIYVLQYFYHCDSRLVCRQNIFVGKFLYVITSTNL